MICVLGVTSLLVSIVEHDCPLKSGQMIRVSFIWTHREGRNVDLSLRPLKRNESISVVYEGLLGAYQGSGVNEQTPEENVGPHDRGRHLPRQWVLFVEVLRRDLVSQ